MKIKGWDDWHIWFEDGATITYEHNQDCCEMNYADFSVLDVFYHGEEFDGCRIEVVDKMGFCLVFLDCCWQSWEKSMAVFIPCYSVQNGYYSTDLTIVVTLADAESDGARKEYPLQCLLLGGETGSEVDTPDFFWPRANDAQDA